MTQLQRISSNNTTVAPRDDGSVVVTLYQTEIVKVFPDRVELNTGGWLTTTTLTRMNQAANELGLGFRASRKGGQLGVRLSDGTNLYAPIGGRRLVVPRPCHS